LHRAMKYAIGPRREIGIRTIFNILGPLTNPAGAKAQILGVYEEALVNRLAGVLCRLGSNRAFVVHSLDGLDEVSICDGTRVCEVKEGALESRIVYPEDFGLKRACPEDIKGGDPALNARIALEILEGGKSPCRDIVVLNAAFAIVAGGLASDITEAFYLAERSIDTGGALNRLNRLIEYTNQ
ncbi:MAG: hypothetical protein P9M03_10815, partial [Candidatus Theseobacter exili]|nr:hypothetical protein [Candidatus Theseobacter exili]